jgi:TonB-dependent starch-binding outer membrane protein SusC
MIYLQKLTLRAKNPALKKYLLAMKLSVIFCFLGMIQVSAAVFSQGTRLTVSYKDTSIKDVLNDIENKTEVRFFYNDDFLNMDRKITLEKTDIKLEDLLSEVLTPSGAKFKLLDDKLIVIAPGEMIQQKVVTGKIKDSRTGDPIPGVSVLVKGTTLGAISDVEGKFRLALPEKTGTLIFSFIGYETQEIPVTEGGNIEVSLVESIKAMDEVVVIGYGSRAKKDVTTAISTVDANEILKTNAGQSAELAMQGKMTGVFVASGGGNPNSRPTIQIRGVGTWGVSQPLYVIDGTPIYEFGYGADGSTNSGYDQSYVARIGTIRGTQNIMSTINPDDIESISVLKDASAAAIYGVRASNGVILITTKKGKGKAKVDFSAKIGTQKIPNRYNMLDVSDYVNLYTEAYANNPLVTLKPYFNPSDPGYLGNLPTQDWADPMYTKNSMTQEYNVSVSGGSDNSSYFVAVGHYKNDGIYILNNLKRYSVTSNVSSKIGKYINVGVNYRFVYQQSQDNTPNSISYTVATPPWQPIYGNGPGGYAPAIDTTYVYTPQPSPADLMPDYWPWQMNVQKLYGDQTHINPYGTGAFGDNRWTNMRNLGNAYVEINPIKGLKIRGGVSLDWYSQKNFNYSLADQTLFSITPNDPLKQGDHHSLGGVGEMNSFNQNLVKNISADYNRAFGKHNIDILLNAESQTNYYHVASSSTEQLNTLIVDRIAVGEYQRGFNSSFTENHRSALIGYLGRLSYNYASKYYLDATLRRDGSYAFAPKNRWGNFPAFSAAWRITGENFLQNLQWLNDMKLRAGWGQLGNSEVKPYMYLSSVINYPHYSLGTTPDNGDARGTYTWGVRLGDFPNEGISWEKTTTTNIAVDAVILKSLNVTIEYYNKITSGLLQTTSLPPSVGLYANPVANIGKVRNSGFEFSVNYTGQSGEFTYNINANLTTVKNKVISMFNHDRIGGNYGMIEEGNSMNYLWGYKVGGIFQSDAEASEYSSTTKDIYATGNIKKGGDMWFQNIHGNADANHKYFNPVADSTVNDYDQTFLGKTIPGFFYGISVNLGYKGFDLSASFTGVGDVQKYNDMLQELTQMDGEINQSTDVLNRWTSSHPSTTFPRAAEGDPGGNNRFSGRFVENAGYLRLSNLQAGYTIPLSKLKVDFAQRIRIWLGGANLFCITPWKGLDPENEANPIPRSFLFGIDATF